MLIRTLTRAEKEAKKKIKCYKYLALAVWPACLDGCARLLQLHVGGAVDGKAAEGLEVREDGDLAHT